MCETVVISPLVVAAQKETDQPTNGPTNLHSLADIQIVEKREAPLLGSRVTESEDHAQWHEKKIKLCF